MENEPLRSMSIQYECKASDGPSQDECEQHEEETRSDREFMYDEEMAERSGPPSGNFEATMQLEAQDSEAAKACKACMPVYGSEAPAHVRQKAEAEHKGGQEARQGW